MHNIMQIGQTALKTKKKRTEKNNWMQRVEVFYKDNEISYKRRA